MSRMSTPDGIVPVCHRLDVSDVHAVMDHLAHIVEEDSGDKRFAVCPPLLLNHGVEAADGVGFQPAHSCDCFCLQSQYRRNRLRFGRMESDIQNISRNNSLSMSATLSSGIFVPSMSIIQRSNPSIFLRFPLFVTYAPPDFFASGTK